MMTIWSPHRQYIDGYKDGQEQLEVVKPLVPTMAHRYPTTNDTSVMCSGVNLMFTGEA